MTWNEIIGLVIVVLVGLLTLFTIGLSVVVRDIEEGKDEPRAKTKP